MFSGGKKLGAAFVVGALVSLTFCSPTLWAENGQALFGVAAITAAASPMVAAGIAASTDVSKANINAATSTYINSLSAATQAYGIGASAEVSEFNTLAALRIQSMNTQKELTQTFMTTAFQAWDRAQNYRLQEEKLASDNYFRAENLRLEKQLADAQALLAQTTFNANLVKQGLASGLAPVKSSLSIQNVNSLASSSATPLQSMTPAYGAASFGLPNVSAPLALQPRATALAQSFRTTSGLAGGSSSDFKMRGDISQFIDANSRAQGPLHQARDIASEPVHDGSLIGALRRR
jgi:hypothetical protein